MSSHDGSSLLHWSNLSEEGKVQYLAKTDDIPFQVLVLASQDASLSVRAAFLMLVDNIVDQDIGWVTLLRRMSQRDPNSTIRKQASQLIKEFAGS